MSNAPVTLIGNLTNDPEIRFADNGNGKISFGMAVDRSWRDAKTNDWKTETSFFNVIGWDPLASDAKRVLGKGVRVAVTGRLSQRSYEKDGDKRSVVEVVADEIAVSVKAIESMERRVRNANGTAPDSGPTSAPAQRKAPVIDDEPF